ncbi:penicillin-binding transpeptidase domain-containing protein [Paenibacillus chartarius]|uniref:Penicillin-binding transpeptidase domain-containing protein n=1 Tax=Paenibacillus chartarius TaxID=747481 RepID=A0ABV6DNC2_9BACL
MPKKLKWRTLMIGGLFTLFFVGLVVRLYWVQVVQASWLLEQAQVRWEADKTIQPARGDIVDRKDKVLAEDAPAYTVAISPRLIVQNKIENDVVLGLSAILKSSEDGSDIPLIQEHLRELVAKKKEDGTPRDQVEVRPDGWKIDKEQADQVKALTAELQARLKKKSPSSVGISLIEEKKRYYPGGTLAAHVLGYSDKEGKAIMGIEAQMDDILKGVPGRINYEKAASGIELPDAKVTIEPAVDGKNVRLTIDKSIQFYIENAMAKVAEKFQPKSMAVVAADPRTMEILGMASYPTFNPNRYWSVGKPDAFMNRTIAAQFEPGSTFKLVTLAGAVEEGLFRPNDQYQSGSIRVSDRTLHDHNEIGWGRISYLDGLKRSSNVAFVKLGLEALGTDKLKAYIQNFGFGAKTNVDIAGELKGSIPMKYASEFATATYGQGLTVTALQQAAAYAAIANGGKLMKPYVVKDIVDAKTGQVEMSTKPEVVRQVVSEATAKQVTEYLEQVVSDQQIGTGRKAYIDGYRIAGKTGTANFVGEKGGYAVGRWNISFVGYAPVENPQILIAIIVEDPDLKGDYHAGSEVGPPLFRDIMAQSLQYLGIPPTVNVNNKSAKPPFTLKEVTLSVPDLVGMSVADAKAAAGKYGLKLETLGNGDKIVKQFPLPGAQITGSQLVEVALQEADLTLPNLVGRSLREAVEVCSFAGVSCTAVGEGYVVGQETAENGVVSLQLRAPDDASAAAETLAADNAAKNSASKNSASKDNSSKDSSTKDSSAKQSPPPAKKDTSASR